MDTVEETFVDQQTKMFAVLRLRKKDDEERLVRTAEWSVAQDQLSLKIKVEGEFWAITAANDAALSELQAITTQQALSMLASLRKKGGRRGGGSDRA